MTRAGFFMVVVITFKSSRFGRKSQIGELNLVWADSVAAVDLTIPARFTVCINQDNPTPWQIYIELMLLPNNYAVKQGYFQHFRVRQLPILRSMCRLPAITGVRAMGKRENATIVVILAGLLALLLPLHAPGSATDDRQASHDAIPGELYLAGNAMKDIALAKKAAISNNKLMLVIMGANWCHDSRALASRLHTQPLDAVIEERYETVFVDVGYLDKGRDVITSFGIPAYYATPTVLVVEPSSGQVINDKNRHQ